jgi:hypothetical protein
MTYVIEYLGEFEFIFETVLDYESGDQMGTFDAKNRHRKSHAWAPLGHYQIPNDKAILTVCSFHATQKSLKNNSPEEQTRSLEEEGNVIYMPTEVCMGLAVLFKLYNMHRLST